MKSCTKCSIVKPLTEFYRGYKGHPISACKVCTRKSNDDWARRNPEKDKAARASWAEKNKEKVIASKRKWAEANHQKMLDIARCYREANREETLRRTKEWQARNPERCRANRKAWYSANKERAFKQTREWRKTDQGRAYVRELRRLRRATFRRACPAWASRREIKEVYLNAVRLTRETGIEHHVDHVVPLHSPLVCGLHVSWNLRVITASENHVKSNRVWPNMP